MNSHLFQQKFEPSDYHVWGAMHEDVLKASSETKYGFWLISHTGESMGKFSAEESCPEF